MKHLFLLLSIFLFVNFSSYSQESGKFGFEFSVSQIIIIADEAESLSPSIGFRVNASENIFLRLKVSYQNSMQEQEVTFYDQITMTSKTEVLEFNRHRLGIGADLAFYVIDKDELNSYVGGGINFSQSKQDSYNYTGMRPELTEITNNSYILKGFIGLEYTPSTQFSIFGEMGINYNWNKRADSELKSTSLGLFNAGVGVTFYLN